MSTEAHLRQSFDTVVARVTQDLEGHLAELYGSWQEQSQRERDELLEDARRRFDAEREERIRAAVDEARQAWQADLAAELARVRQESDDSARQARREAEEEVARAHAEADAATRQAEEALRAWEVDFESRVREAVARAREAWAGEHADALALVREEGDSQISRALADAALASEALRVKEEEARLASTTWADTEQQLRAQLTVAESQLADAVDALALAERAALATARDSMQSGLDRLLGAVERLDACTSLKTTVDVLAQSVAAVVPRSMTFIVRGDELRGWHFHGLTEAPDPFTVNVAPAHAGQLSEAAMAGASRRVPTDTFDGPLAFAAMREPRLGLAVPVVLGHATVALIYGDDGGTPDHTVPPGWEAIVQVLARHASRHLEALTAARSVRLAGQQRPAPAAPPSGMLSSTSESSSAAEPVTPAGHA